MWNPRVGGEKGARRGPALGRTGSPPHGRGKDGESTGIGGADGITPAQAGKSYCPATRSFWSWDHPRADGEKSAASVPRYPGSGSPPRGRGKVVEICDVVALVGITPAWAGKRENKQQDRTITWDHPRAGGEKAQLVRTST